MFDYNRMNMKMVETSTAEVDPWHLKVEVAD